MSTLNEDLEQIKNKEDNIASSKVARFCYTEQAYQGDDYEGVPEFDPSAEQNIPLANPDTLKTNATVFDRGFRSQASSLPRMLVNHFFGRVSYNLNKAHDNLVSLITAIKSFIGQPNGIASLDENGRIPYSQLPESALNLRGDWDASTNTPELSDGMEGATLGDMYYVNVGGTVDFGHGEISFLPNDRAMYNQYNQWVKLSAGNVRKVNNKEPDASEGNVTVYGTDINVSEEENMNIIEKMKQYAVSTLLGRHWLRSDKKSDNFRAVYYANGVWVAGSLLETGLWYSIDGQHWLQSDKKDNHFSAVYYANGVWVAGSWSNTGLWYSIDGQHWLQSDKADGKFYAVYYANGVWVAGSDSGTGLWYSTDGQHWLQSDKKSDSFSTVYYANGVWVAGSDTGLWYSSVKDLIDNGWLKE